MKKIRLILAVSFCSLLLLTGCADYEHAVIHDEVVTSGAGYFITEKEWKDFYGSYSIVYAKDTKVKYLIVASGYQYGITPLYNADGTLQIYEEE